MFEAANRRDIDAALAPFHTQAEFEVLAAVDSPTVHRGRDAVRSLFESIWSAWPATESVAERVLEQGDAVVLQTRDRRTGRDGVVVEGIGAQVWRFEGERVVRVTGFRSWSEAVAAL